MKMALNRLTNAYVMVCVGAVLGVCVGLPAGPAHAQASRLMSLQAMNQNAVQGSANAEAGGMFQGDANSGFGAGAGAGSGVWGAGAGLLRPQAGRNVAAPNAGAAQAAGAGSTQHIPPVALPERPITPFQQMVFETTGRLLPLFGENMLQKTYDAQGVNAPVSADYEVGAGDELNITIWGSLDASVNAVVDREGKINIPSVGSFSVAGVKARNLESHLTAQVGRYYKNFNLSAAMGRLGGVHVYVAGQALAPGMHNVPSTSTLASVVFSVAQPGVQGSFRDIQLRRAGQIVARFDLYELLREGQLTGDRKLQAGDVLFVAPAGPRVALNIDGPAAAIFEMKPQGAARDAAGAGVKESLGDLLALSGVAPALLRPDLVLIEGFNPKTGRASRAVRRYALEKAIDEANLKDGDVVSLFTTRRDFDNAITMRGNVADPGRYPHTSGMTVADLLPSPMALVQPDYHRRKNALVGFDGNKADRAFSDPRLQQHLSLEEQSEYLKRLERLSPGSVKPTNDPKQPLWMPERSSTSLGGLASINRPIPSAANSGEKLDALEDSMRNLLTQINWDYAVVERLDVTELKPVLLPFNLRKAMARDAKHNIVLQPGDVLTVFSTRDTNIPKSRGAALVKVTGEVGAPGYYQITPGETLRDVLVKAGGLTENAFPYGTNLARRSILRMQEEQFNKALDQAERLLLASSNKNSASALNPAEAANVQAQSAAQRAYLERLRNVKPDGRVVLAVKPSARAETDLPPVVLEDGDSILVPSVPGQVAVFGSVYTQGAFAFQPGKTVFDFVNMAGGAAKSSDKSSIFVLRANGSVDSAQQSKLPFVSGLLGERAQPGDAIYVPEDFERVSFMKSLLDISQIFYQVGLGAAAVKAIQD